MPKNNTIIVWFRNDLRLQDNEALYKACQHASHIIPLYCIDPRHFQATAFGFPKTGAFRTQFLLESLRDLKFRLQDLGGDLIVRTGKPEDIIFGLAKFYKVKAVYCHQEATHEEMKVEDKVIAYLDSIGMATTFFWGQTLYHYDDLPNPIDELPDVFTTFRQQVEKRSDIRPAFPVPTHISLPDAELQSGDIPQSINEMGLSIPSLDKRSVLKFKGGETAALLRLKHYFWEGDHLQRYKETRNGLIGADYSSKFSPWLADGCMSPRLIYEEIKRYEEERIKNKSTYWLVFELIWRDYFRFVAMKYGNDLFKSGGIKREKNKGKQDQSLFQKWVDGQTGVPFVDANMRELKATGFMSNRGRQNVASFLVKDMGIDWRMGAAYFESVLLDYDPCSNYGNWNYVAGIGNDPRENRYFNVLVQAKRYDPKGEYVKLWCPELRKLPSSRIHEPYLLNKAEQKYVGVHLGRDYPHLCIDINHWKAKRRKG